MNSLLIGKKAPLFKTNALVKGKIVEDFSLDRFLGEYIIFFFYPRRKKEDVENEESDRGR